MKSIEIQGSLRKTTGKKDSKKLRALKDVPCVLYSKDETIHFSAPFSQFRPLIYTPDVYTVNLVIDGNTYGALLQDAQWHPVEEQLLHVDFLRINENTPIKVNLPIQVEGTAIGIKAGGKMKLNLRNLRVKGLVKDMPDAITLDVSRLDLGQSLKVGDLKLSGIEFLTPKTNVIATVSVTRAARAALSGKETKK